MKLQHKTKLFSAIALAFSSTLLLSACGGSKIDAVKKYYADDNRTTTYSQLLDNREICDSFSWKMEKDSKERDVVVYSCHLKGSKDAFVEEREQYKKDLKKRSDNSVQHKQNYLQQLKEDNKNNEAEEQQLIADYEKLGGKVALKNCESGAADNTLINGTSDCTNPGIIYKRQRVIELANKRIEMMGSGSASDYDIRNIVSNEKRAREDFEAAGGENMYALCKQENDKAQSCSTLRTLDARLERAKTRNDKIRQTIADSQKEVDELLSLKDAKTLEAKSTEKYPVTTDFVETFKWIVNDDNEPTLMSAEMAVKTKKADGSEGLIIDEPMNYSLSKNLAKVIEKNKSKNAKEYFAEVVLDGHLVDFFLLLEIQNEKSKEKVLSK